MRYIRKLFPFLTAVILCVYMGTICTHAAEEDLVVLQDYSEEEWVVEVTDDLSAGIVQKGGLLETATDSYFPDRQRMLAPGDGENAENVKAALLDGMRNWQTKIDLSAYQISGTELGSIYSALMNSHADLFYVKKLSKYWYNSSGYVTKAEIAYEEGYTAENVQLFYSTCDKIINEMPSGITIEQKALYLHDYIVTHCEYDLTYSNYNAYNVLVEGSAVCQGYAEAYCYLCDLADVDSYLVTSDENNHAWNLVVVDGNYYFVDCTWDDPANHWYEAHCRHSNFLRSRDGMVEQGHKAQNTDWTTTEFGNVYGMAVDSTKYDSYYWSEIITAIPLISDTYAYAYSNDNSNVYMRYFNGAERKISIGQAARWYVWGQSSYWTTYYFSFVRVKDAFYFNTQDTIYRLRKDGTIELFYQLNDEEKATGYLYGIVAEGNTIYYTLGTVAYNNENFIRKSIQVPVEQVEISFDKNGGSGEMSSVSIDLGESYSLPACGFSAPENTVFAGWQINGVSYSAGDTITLNENVIAYAIWMDCKLGVEIKHTCSVQNNLSLNYKVKILSEGDFQNVRLVIEQQVFEGTGTEYSWDKVTLTDYTIDENGRYCFYYRNLAAKEMGSIVKATVVAEKGNDSYMSDVDNYSIKQYAEAVLTTYGSNTDERSRLLCTFIVDMLNYGSAAQLYFGYNTSNLVNGNLSDEMKARASAIDTDYTSCLGENPLEGATAQVSSRSLVLGNSVELKTYLTFGSTVPGDDVSVTYSYTSLSGSLVSVTVNKADFVYESNNDRYAAKMSGIVAKDFSQPISIVITKNGVPISGTYTFSYETYAGAMVGNTSGAVSDTLKNLLNYMMAYSRSAKLYFK